MTTTHPHEIVEDGLGGNAVCHAEPGADCRMGCPDGVCEEWFASGCQCGPLADHGSCWAVEWLNALGLTDTRMDDEEGISLDTYGQETYRGPIDVEWSDGYLWAPAIMEPAAVTA